LFLIFIPTFSICFHRVLHISLSFNENISAACGLLASGLIGVADGFIAIKFVGHGEWNHWCYPPGLFLVALALFGLFDRKETGSGKVKKA